MWVDTVRYVRSSPTLTVGMFIKDFLTNKNAVLARNDGVDLEWSVHGCCGSDRTSLSFCSKQCANGHQTIFAMIRPVM